MDFSRRSWAAGTGLALTLPGLLGRAFAADTHYPSKPVRIVVQYQAGGPSDGLARLLAEGLGDRLGQPVVVENRSGAGGIIGTDHVAKSQADGYTLLLSVPAPITANLALYRKLPYDPRTDLRLVSDIAVTRTVLCVHPSVPAKSFKELIEAVRGAPGRFAMGSWGPGTQPHQVQVFMDRHYGLQTVHVAYKGEAPMALDLVSGVIQMTVGSVSTLQPHIAAGELRALAVAGSTRSKRLPEVSTFAEQGFLDDIYMLTAPTSLLLPSRTSEAIVQRLGREVVAVMQQPGIRRRIEELGAEPVGNSPAEAAAAYAKFLPVSLALIRATGVTLD